MIMYVLNGGQLVHLDMATWNLKGSRGRPGFESGRPSTPNDPSEVKWSSNSKKDSPLTQMTFTSKLKKNDPFEVFRSNSLFWRITSNAFFISDEWVENSIVKLVSKM